MATACDVARYILSLVDETEGDFVTPLKLQKLLYYCQGFHLALFGTPLYAEQIRRLKYGPMVMEVQEHFAAGACDPIRCPADVDFEALTPDEKELIGEVYEVYGAYSPSALRSMTQDEPPWRDTPDDQEISHAALESFFRTRILNG